MRARTPTATVIDGCIRARPFSTSDAAPIAFWKMSDTGGRLPDTCTETHEHTLGMADSRWDGWPSAARDLARKRAARQVCLTRVGALAATLCIVGVNLAAATQLSPAQADKPGLAPTLEDAQSHFYNARYKTAADLALELRSRDPEDLANLELRSSALLFQLKALLEPPGERHTTSDKREKERALKACAACPELMAEFFKDISQGQGLARARLKKNPHDEAALFYLGKLDLNYVWLELGPLGRRTGWDEYWEARRSLEAVIKEHPGHVRALVARAWIDYIVDTKMPWGTKWVLGGGSRKRALAAVRAAAAIDSDLYSHTEAEFALWDLQVRERLMAPATELARQLALKFPDNKELAAFLASRETSVPQRTQQR